MILRKEEIFGLLSLDKTLTEEKGYSLAVLSNKLLKQFKRGQLKGVLQLSKNILATFSFTMDANLI
jgi:hypothetical protein